MMNEDKLKLMQQWLKHAPQPPARGDNTYDVFISYRSSDRRWAMALYDALKMAAWEPFLDQYDLVPGTDLETSLSEALEASSAGVVLWSSRTKDSVWCNRERNAMRTLKDRGTFNYVFAKLDQEPLPLFAQSDLYIDFLDTPDGPRGVNLLRMICGLSGVALPKVAVELAQRVDEDIELVMIDIRGAEEANNANRLVEIGASDRPGLMATPAPILAVVNSLISLGEYQKAGEVSSRALEMFPQSLRAHQLKGLLLRRQGEYQAAIDVLSKLKVAGHQDPETLGILAAAWDGLYCETGKKINLRRSRELYRTAFQGDPKNYYTGINVATKSLFLGEQDEATRLADKVLPLVQHASEGEDFWAGCTLGEVLLLRGELDQAAKQFQKVIDRHAAKAGDLKSTQLQAERICAALVLSDEDAEHILAPFKLLEE